MPIFGLGIHVVIAIFFAIHAIRNNQNMYWLLILFMFPLFGSIVYFFAIFMPSTRIESKTRKFAQQAIKVIDPTKELRDAKANFEFTPTAQNQARYANALLNSGQNQEALENFENCLKGIFANDLNIISSAANAALLANNPTKTIHYLDKINEIDPNFRYETCQLSRAKALSLLGDKDGASAAFKAAYDKAKSFEALIEYTIHAFAIGDFNTANVLKQEIDMALSRQTKHAKQINSESLKRLQSEIQKMRGN